MSGIDRDLWLDAIAHAIPPTDPNALTTREFAKNYGFKMTSAKKRLQALEDAGMVERVTKFVQDRTGRAQHTPAWRLIPAAKPEKKPKKRR